MVSSDAAAVLSVGARSALGASARQLAACARAGMLSPRSTHFVDARGRSVGMCVAPGLPDDVVGYERMLRLASAALREAAPANAPPLAVVLALPEEGRADDDPRFATSFVADLARRAGVALDLDRSVI